MKTRITRIGNSKGVRIPKPLLEQVGLVDEVEMQVEGGRIVIGPAASARAGWRDAFQRMAAREDDALLDDSVATTWDVEEWQWR